MPETMTDTSNAYRVTIHCARCRRRVGERHGPWVFLGCGNCGVLRVRKRFEVHCGHCGHRWWENVDRGCEHDEVPRTSQV